MEFGIILLSTIMKSVPIFCLIFFVFYYELKYSLFKTVLCTALFVILIGSLSYYMSHIGYLYGMNEVFFSVVVLVAAVFMLQFFLNNSAGNVRKITFTVFIIKSIIDSILLTARLYKSFLSSGGIHENLIYVNFVKTYGFTAIFFDGFFIVVATIGIFFLIKYFLRPLIQVTEDMPLWRYIWLIPVSLFIIFRFIVYPSYFSERRTSDSYILSFAYIWLVCMVVVYIVVLKMLLQTANNLQLRKELELSNLYMDMQKERYNTLQKSNEEMRRIHHDSKHQVAILQGYVKNHDMDSIENALNMRLEYLDNTTHKPYCENYTLDAIIWNYAKLSEENGIDISIKVIIPNDTFISAIDLCVLFGNLIENGFEACCRQKKGNRFLKLWADTIDKNTIAIRVNNSYEGEILKSGNKFLSSKREEEGIGLRSIHSIAVKYNGTVKTEFENQIFTTKVLLTTP